MRNLILIIFIFLNGCSFAPEFQRPEVKLSQKFVVEEKQRNYFAQSPWWDFIKDPLLKRLISEGIDSNKDLLIAASRIEQARAQLGFVEADLFPRLDIAGEAYRINPSDKLLGSLTTFGIQNRVGLYSQLSYQLDFWGRYRNASHAAKYRLLSSQQGLISLKLSLVSEIARTYFLILDFENQKTIAKNTFVNRKDATKLIKSRLEKGIIPELDLNQAEIEEASAAIVAIEAERGSALAKNIMATLLGKTELVDSEGKHYNFGINNLALNYYEETEFKFSATVLQQRPDVLAAESIARASLAEVGVAKANRLPNFNIFGSIGYLGENSGQIFEKPALTWDIGGQFLGPLIDFGKAKSGVDLAKAQAQEALLAYENSLIKASQEVEDAIVEIRSYRQESEQRKSQVKSARNASKLSRARYDNGFTSYLEVLDVERSLFEAELAASNTSQRYYSSIIKLYEALGGGWIKATEASPEMKIVVSP